MNILMNRDDESKEMAQKMCRYISERRDKKELALLKEKPKKEKGGINTRLEKVAKSLLGKRHEPLALLIKQKKAKTQSALEFQQDKYKTLLSLLDEHQLENQIIDIKNEYSITLQTINQDHEPCEWLNQWAEKARDISFATHVAKLTHSSSKSSSVYDKTAATNSAYLTTNILKGPDIDIATANSASAPAGEILTLQVNNKSLLDYIKENNRTAFECLTDKQENIDTWMSCFKQAYDSEKKTSHFLSKQVYFPIDNESYHLLLPLMSSSLAQSLHLKFKAFFDDDNAQIRDQKNKNKYHDKLAISYPNRATLNITGSNHSNASSLNGKRGGRVTLLVSKPPQWKSGQQLPLKQTTLFNRRLGFKLQEEIHDLQRLLLIIKTKGLGVNKPVMHQAIVSGVNEIAQGFFVEVMRINLVNDDQGWTQHCALPLSQQLLLEPYRNDEVAIQEKNKKQWQAEVADDCSYWLNRQLKHKQLNLTPIQQRLWKDIFSHQLREFIAAQEATS